MIAAFFGLVNGLAFASTLKDLGIGRWERVASILGFNLGIETMQLAIVASILPSLLILSRTAAYMVFRFTGALFAGVVSVSWIAERLFNIRTSVDVVVDGAAHLAVWIAVLLFLMSVVCWSVRDLLTIGATETEAVSQPSLRSI